MKRIKFIAAIALMAGLMITTSDVIAQRGQGKGMMNNPEGRRGMYNAERPRSGECILNLTPEQDTKVTELRTKHLKEVTPLRNEIAEKRTRLRTLQSVDKPDLKEINKTIDEMAAIRANIQKKGAAHRAEVSSLLTEEQRVLFNARKGNRMGHGNMGRGCRR